MTYKTGDWVRNIETGDIGEIVNHDGAYGFILVNFFPVGGDTIGLTRFFSEYEVLDRSNPATKKLIRDIAETCRLLYAR